MPLPKTTFHTLRLPDGDFSIACLERQVGEQVEEGGGGLILFVHGLACLKESFSHAFDYPGLMGFSLLVPDLPGHGETGDIPGFSYSMEDTAAVLAALLDAVPHRRLHIVAHSMGGAVALLMIKNHGVTPATFLDVEGNLTPHDCGLLSRRAADMEENLFVTEKFARLIARAGEAEEDDTRLWASWAAKTVPAAFHRASGSLVSWSDLGRLLEIYRGLSCPKMYVYGSRSAMPAVLSALRQAGEGGRTYEIPMAGHFSMSEEPAMFYEVVEKVVLSV